jgi:RNA polymerase sigma-70 factor, ECF subfamily
MQDPLPFTQQPIGQRALSSSALKSEPASGQRPTEASLMQGVARGDEQALISLYDRYAQTVYALAMCIVREPATAEDIVQETLIQVWRAASTWHGEGGGFQAWLFRIARNLCLDHLRRQRVRPKIDEPAVLAAEAESLLDELVDPSVDVAQTGWERVRHAQLHHALSEIPAAQRHVLELAYFEGLTHVQITQYLDVPLGTVKTRLRLGLWKLASLVNREI